MAPSVADPSSSSSSPTKHKRKHKDVDAKAASTSASASASTSTPNGSSSKKSKADKDDKKASKKSKDESSSKKAKVEAGQATLKVVGAGGSRSANGLALAAFPDYLPADSAEFSLYRGDAFPGSSTGAKGGFKDERLVLAGGTKSIEYLGDNLQLGSAPDLRGYSGEYMVGIYDPSTSTVTLRAAPLFTVSRSIKALKTLDAAANEEQDDGVSMFYKQRKGLEGTFGNAKARKARINQERMRVDISQVFGSVDEVTESITQSTANLPSAEELQAIDFKSRPIPPHEPSATKPADVYPVRTLIEPSVMKQVPIDDVLELASEDDVRSYLEPLKAGFLAARLWTAVQNAQFELPDPPAGASQDLIDSFTKRQTMARDDAHDRVRMTMYLVYLVGFMLLYKDARDVRVIKETMGLASSAEGRRVFRDITERFTGSAKGSSKIYMSGMEQTKFLAYSCAILLHIDHYTVAYEPIAKGLQLEPSKLMEIFRSIGCTQTRKEVANADAEFGETKKQRAATLSLPLKFPEPRKKRVAK
ncbi:DNA-directed RNA polymerase I subunit rpa49 [Thecaphora frezii]